MNIDKLIIKLNEKVNLLDISNEGLSVITKYLNKQYEIEIRTEEDYTEYEELIVICNNILNDFTDVEIDIQDTNWIVLRAAIWKNDIDVNIGYFVYDWIHQFITISSYIKEQDEKIVIDISEYIDGGITLKSEDWRRELQFGGEIDGVPTIDETIIKNFFEYNYDDLVCCYGENYLEYPIKLANEFYFGPYLYDAYSVPDKINDKGITFEISKISEFFWNHCLRHQYAEGEENYNDTQLTTLKIYNLNSFLGISTEDPSFQEKGLSAAKNTLFKLSHKHGIELDITQIPDFDDESYYNDDLPEKFSKLDHVEDHTMMKLYDNDLINYYYRAMNMEDSEFKYLAFYQILECIFDEVHLHATVQDVKHIINSDWFSKHNDEDIKIIIQMVETYNKQKKDREKLLLVLERHLKGTAHDKAFLIANRSIINHLIAIKKIKNEEEFKDLQKIVNLIYDFRCKCTHSNRTYPFRSSFEDTNEELTNYIILIKKLAERIIINYQY
jgi:hypothetical protein